MEREKNKPVIDLQDDNFGMMLNFAVRYCIGRMSYAPSETIRFIAPLLPYLNDRTLKCFDNDISERARQARNGKSFGMDFDQEMWMAFWFAVQKEITRRMREEKENG